MRKRVFYPKLALGNLWRNKTTYIPYILACTVSIFTFYVMLAINLNGALDGIRGEGVVRSFTSFGTVVLAIFCSVLIFYTNSFLIKRRKNELGLYSILGMEKKNLAILMFFETFFVAVIALVLGLLLGVLLSRLLFLALLRMIRFPVTLTMPISLPAIGITVALFGAIFLLALLANLYQVRLANPIDLMAGAKHGEKEPKASFLLTLLGIVSLGAGYFIALHFKRPGEALGFFFVAVIFVIIGTYCLFTSGSIFVLKLMRRNKRYYYKPNHFISVSGLIYRMKQNAAGLATICILSCMVLVTVSSTVSLYVGAEDSLLVQYPDAYSFYYEEDADAGAMLEYAAFAAAEHSVQLTDMQDYKEASFGASGHSGVYGHYADNGAEQDEYVQFSLRLLSDYSRCEGRSVTLGEGEALLYEQSGAFDGGVLTLFGVPIRVQTLDALGSEKENRLQDYPSFVLILPDQAAVDAITQAGELEQFMMREITFETDGSQEAVAAFHGAFMERIGSQKATGARSYRTREDARLEWYASNGGFLFLGVYFGTLFMLAAAMIIYYKQVSEGYDDAARFEILQKVGMSGDEVKKTINSQILAVFFLPLIVTVIHIAVAFFPISRVMVIFGVTNVQLLLIATIASILAYALVYLLVFRRTARTYFRIVRRQGA